jgi:diguanylate cyclase (GGDEF)-like protein/PAS domain S-box-containing protein
MEGRHLKVNQAFCEMVGKSMQDVEGKEHYEIWGVTPEQYEEGEYVCLETDKAIAANPKPTLFLEQVLHSKLGLRQLETYKAPIFDEDGKMIGNIGVAKDVTDEYATKERILLLSRTDELTRLANRRYFYQFVDMHRRKGSGELTLCYVDLDYFKQLNDTFGHQYGDAALMAIGELLERAFPKDFIARLGGDEFVVIYEPVGAGEICVAVKHFTGIACDQVQTWDLTVQDGAVVECTGGSYSASPEAADMDALLVGEWLEAETQFTQMTIEANEERGWDVEIVSPVSHGAYVFKTSVLYDCDMNCLVYGKGKIWDIDGNYVEGAELGEAREAGTIGAFSLEGDEEHPALEWHDDTTQESIVFERAVAA